MATGYASNVNYSEEIQKRKDTGDLFGAAQLEQQRNAKIVGEGLNYAQTNDYVSYLTPQGNAPDGDMIRSMNAARTQSQINALNTAMNSSLGSIESARAQIPQTYRDARNQTAGQGEVQRANFNQYASNAGLNSGAGGQAQLAFASDLQGNLGSLNRQEAQAMSDITRQESNLKAEYASKIAQAQADGDYNTMSMLYSQWQNDQNYLRQQTANDQNYLRQQTANEETTGYARAVDRANASGIFTGMSSYGWSPDEIDSANRQWQMKNTPKVTGGGGGGGGPKDTNIYSLIKTSNLDPYTFLAMYGNKYNIASGEIDGVVRDYKAWLENQTAPPVQRMAPPDASGMAAASVKVDANSFTAAARGMMSSGRSAEYVKNYIADMYDKGMLANSQVAAIIGQLGI